MSLVKASDLLKSVVIFTQNLYSEKSIDMMEAHRQHFESQNIRELSLSLRQEFSETFALIVSLHPKPYQCRAVFEKLNPTLQLLLFRYFLFVEQRLRSLGDGFLELEDQPLNQYLFDLWAEDFLTDLRNRNN